MNFQEREIEVADEAITIRERCVQDVLDTEEFFQTTDFKESDDKIFIKKHLMMLNQAIKHNWEQLPWYRFITKWRLARKLSMQNIMLLIPTKQLWEFSIILYELEGTDTSFLKVMISDNKEAELEKLLAKNKNNKKKRTAKN